MYFIYYEIINDIIQKTFLLQLFYINYKMTNENRLHNHISHYKQYIMLGRKKITKES